MKKGARETSYEKELKFVLFQLQRPIHVTMKMFLLLDGAFIGFLYITTFLGRRSLPFDEVNAFR